MDKGVYCLIFECIASKNIRIGALGKREFLLGWYLYVGSALGNGGLSRVNRHIRFYREQYRKPKWHIDYLMMDRSVRFRKVMCARTEMNLECVLAAVIGGDGVSGFGCSDCDCEKHLFYREEIPEMEIFAAFKTVGLCGTISDVDVN
ncbi:MAG: GIY-YIG nuclease family protein [Methanocalculaceae archaeon]|jgi:Uri superfamily endonuclease|nr:GIY-YIG nuclease family protein [Methanocalculaceae archaeon]